MVHTIYEDEIKLKKMICEIMKMLYLKGLITPLAGNISYRISDNRILITPSRRIKYLLETDDIAVVDIDGNHIEGPKPTSELKLHLEVYRRARDAKAVVHIHGVVAPVFAEEFFDKLVKDLESHRLLDNRICIAPVLPPGSTELAMYVGNLVEKNCRAIILEKHGVVGIGSTLEEAVELVELVELTYKRTLIKEMLHSMDRIFSRLREQFLEV